MPAIKIDVKSYPEFDGQLKNWKGFKQNFKSVASMHGIGYLLNKTCEPPTDTNELVKFHQQNTFIQSILEYSLAKGNALTRVKKFSEKQMENLVGQNYYYGLKIKILQKLWRGKHLP